MAINMHTPGVHHINALCSDLAITKNFYENIIYSDFRLETDHTAIACETEDELNRVAKGLTDAGVENTGVKLDETLHKL